MLVDLTYLDLSGNQYTAVPNSLSVLTDLRELHFSNMAIVANLNSLSSLTVFGSLRLVS